MSRSTNLLNAFRPGAEIEDPALFAGRAAQIEELARALHTEKACPIIYGDRGLGKSSLALQGRRIATGDCELLHRQNLSRWGFDEDGAFVTSYVQCTDAVRNTSAILQRLLNSLRDAIDPELRPVSKALIDQTTRRKLNVKFLELESESRFERRTRSIQPKLDVEEALLEAVDFVAELTGHRVMLIVDELDRVADTRGLASFIKSNSTGYLRFMLVGIAQSISDLLTDHQSLERLAIPVNVPSMSRKELEVVVERVEEWLHERDVNLAFEPGAKRYLAEIANGYPWFVHVLGQQSLLYAEEDGELLVGLNHVKRSVATLTQNRFAQQFKDLYQMAVRDSLPRELVLRAFASWNGQDIPTRDVYRVLRDGLDVNNPSTYKGHLCKEQYGRVLITPAYQNRGMVRFQNEMFKVYVRLRGSLYEDAKERVDAAWADRD